MLLFLVFLVFQGTGYLDLHKTEKVADFLSSYFFSSYFSVNLNVQVHSLRFALSKSNSNII